MVSFSCDGDSDNITEFSSSSASLCNTSSHGSDNSEGSSEQELRKKALKKAVTFSEIQVWEFEACVGDNPALSSGGCPVALSNKHTRTTSMPVEVAEAIRHHFRRSVEELLLDRESREARLLASGCTRKEIADGVRKALQERRARDLTNQNHEWDKVHESFEAVRRKLTKPFRANSAALLRPVSRPSC